LHLLGALAFLVAVFSRSMRMFLNTVASEVMFFTLLAFVFGFAPGWLPAITQVSGVIREVMVYFGFLRVVMLVVMFRDVKNELTCVRSSFRVQAL
jgi:F0F1-type ATP synthase membrane subunit a